MCDRFASTLSSTAVHALFATSGPLPNVAPNWNVAPTNSAMVVGLYPETGKRWLDQLRWGLIPSWTKSLKQPRPINGKSETAAMDDILKGALAERRCLVPADAFYAWKTTPGGKQPYAIARRDGSPLAFAGVWERWKAPNSELVQTFAILTTAANATMRQVHERMPVILEPDAWSTWLGEDGDAAIRLMRPADDNVLRIWPVSRAVSLLRNNSPYLLDRIEGL